MSAGLAEEGTEAGAQARRRERVLVAAGLAAERLLQSRLDRDALQEGLRLLGEATGARRVYVGAMQRAPDGRVAWQPLLDWWLDARPSDEPEARRRAPWPVAGERRWREWLGRGEALRGPVEELPAAEREELESRGVRSLAVLPLRAHGELWGLLGFEDDAAGQDWSEGMIAALRVAAGVIGAAWERRDWQARSLALLEQYRELVDSLQEIVFRADRAACFTFLSPAWYEVLGHDHADSLGRRGIEFVHPADRRLAWQEFRALVEGTRREYRRELRMRCADGSHRWFLVHARVLSAPGRPPGFAGTMTDIQEAKEAEATLIAARTAAEEAARAKSEFLSTMSHELRTPLNAVIGLTESLLESEPPYEPVRTRRYLGLIHQSGRQLLAQINDILELARLEAGRVQVAWEDVDLGAMCAGLLATVRAEAPAGAAVVTLRLPAAPVRVPGDERLLRQALHHLVGNAVKFTPPGGGVEVRVRPVADGAELAVVDTGIGIPADKLAQVFQPFTQVDSSARRKFGGTGLGLAIVDRIMRLHHGLVRVESQVGEGSCFTLTLRAEAGPVEGRTSR